MIRLQRVGRTNDPSFRVVLVDSRRATRTGNVIEVLGNYDARKGAPVLRAERIAHWMSHGAQATDTVHNLLVKHKHIVGSKKHVSRLHAKEKKGKVK